MRLANSWRSQKDDIFCVMDELQRSNLFDRCPANGRLKLEIEII